MAKGADKAKEGKGKPKLTTKEKQEKKKEKVKNKSQLFQFFDFFRKSFDIFTDGSHKGKWGSWSFVIVSKNKIIHESSGRIRNTNSHRMEFQAAIEALSFLKKRSKVRLYSDSRVLVKVLTEPRQRLAVNTDQLLKLDRLKAEHDITFSWVKAHSGVGFNERCDELCRLARGGS